MTDLEKLIQNGKTKQNKNNPKIKEEDKAKKLSQLSLKQYTASINKLYKSLNTDKDITKLLWLEEHKKDIKKFIVMLNTPNTRKTYISVIITLLYNDEEKFKDLIKFYIDISKENYDNIKIHTKKEKSCDDEKIVSLTDYDDMIKRLSKNNCYDKEYIMFLMLRYYPIRNEIGSFIYIKNADYSKLDLLTKKSANWIVEKSKSFEMIRYHFKTAQFYASELPFVNVIEQPVKSALKKYIKDNTIISSKPLFPIQDKQMTENQVSHRLALVSGKNLPVKISTSTIFKILACDAVKNNTTNEARKILTKYGKIRGTDISNIIEYYINGKAIHDDNKSDKSDDKWLYETNVSDIYKPLPHYTHNNGDTIQYLGGREFNIFWNYSYINNDIDALDRLHKVANKYQQVRLNRITLFGRGKMSYHRRHKYASRFRCIDNKILY